MSEAERTRTFSPSRLGTYQDCPRRYRYRYIDKIKREGQSVEAFLGTCVHRALEELYDGVMHGRLMSEAELLAFFDAQWDKDWSGAVVIRDKRYGLEDWRRTGREALSLYYKEEAPFDREKTVGLEKRMGFPLEAKSGTCRIEGFIDRLALAKDGAFEIHDYKTGKSLPAQEELDADWQLALYDAAVRHAWPDAQGVRLVWHYLRHGKTLVSTRTPAALGALKADVARLIDAISAEREFAPRESPLCGWCEYRDLCPLWAHAEKIAKLDEPARGREEGAKLVDALEALEERKKSLHTQAKTLEDEEAELKEKIARFAEAEGITAVFGAQAQAVVTEKKEYKFPTKTHAPESFAALEKELKASPFWTQASHFDAHRFLESRRKGEWSEAQRAAMDDIVARYAVLARERAVRLKRRKDEAED